MSYKAALIIPYFGILPNYFNLWLKSASFNKEFDFLIFTDNDMKEYDIPDNVKIINMTFDDVKNRIKTILDYPFVLHKAYKLCDYKPLYGLIFEDYLKAYDFWGHCDSDIIWGNISKFIHREHFEMYDRIYARGHLCIYRNCEKINYAALKRPARNFITAKDVYTHRYIAHFDEGSLIIELLDEVGARHYVSLDFADIRVKSKQFVCEGLGKNGEEVVYFYFDNGKLKGVLKDKSEMEFAYIHLQKRKMEFARDLDEDQFLIVPNCFLPYKKTVSQSEFEEWERRDLEYEYQYEKNRKKAQIEHILDGALVFRYKNIKNKLFKKKCDV